MSWLTCLDLFQNTGAFWVRLCYDFALKSLFLLLAVFFLYEAVRHLPSAFRHFLLSLAFFCLSVLPLCLIWGPEWQLPFLSAPPFLRSGGPKGPGTWPFLLLGIWLVGFVAVMLRLAAGLWVTGRLRRESWPLDDPDWSHDVSVSSCKLGLRGKVPVLINHRLGAAICAGIIRPCVIVPATALEWSDEQRRTILHHELGHVKRRDNLTNVFSLAVCGFYWFNPLVWWAAARLRICRESACDDLVLNCGTRPSRYVSYLLQATSTPQSRLISVTLSQISALKKRVLAILNPHVDRRTIGLAEIVACSLVAATVVISLSALQPWIIPSFTAGLREKLGLTQLPGVRLAAQLFFPADTPEGRGQLQTDGQSGLLRLPPGFLPAGAPPVFADRYPTQVLNISSPTGRSAAPRAAVGYQNPAGLATTDDSSRASNYPPATATPYGSVVSRGNQPPTDPPPADPGETPADLAVSLVSLGTLGGSVSQASDINETGYVVGASTDGLGKGQPFVWSKAEGMSSLPCPSGDCHAIDITNSGHVLVIAFDETATTSTSYLWSPDNTVTDIGSLGGKSTRALKVNEQGQVIGTSVTSFGNENAFFWSRETGMVDLGRAKPVALNERGYVVGWASSYAFFWNSATDAFDRIGELDTRAHPFDMNSRGEVVGYAHIGAVSQPTAFYWNPVEGELTEIEFPGAPAFSCAFRINDAGEVLAIAKDPGKPERTFSWRPGQAAREQSLPDFLLPQLEWELMSASTSSTALIGSNLPSVRLAEELARVDFRVAEEPSTLAQPVKMNGRGQIAGNLLRPDRSEIEAVLWEIRLPKVEESIREVLGQLDGISPSFNLRLELNSALAALAQNDYPAAVSNLSSFLETVVASESSIPASLRARWIQSTQESLDRISHFTILE